MKKLFTLLFASATLYSFAQTNVPNGSFETWSSGVPNGWIKEQGRVRQYASKSFTLNTSQGQVTGTLNPANGSSFLGLLNDSPAVDGAISIGRLKTQNFRLGRRPGEFIFNFYYLAGVQTETFAMLLYGWYESFGVNDTIFRKVIYFNQTGVLGTLPFNGNYGWLSATVPLPASDYIDNQTPDSASIMILPTGVFAQGAPRATSLNTELLIDNLRFNPFTTSNKLTLKSNNQIAAYNYPNPAADYTTFVYELPVKSDVTINIYDINGKLVDTKFFAKQEQGIHQTFYNTANFTNGIYFYNIETEFDTESGKLIINK
ncbi:MAG: T9SS type A sorting domain-containing protein [Bacteroidia bacterium]